MALCRDCSKPIPCHCHLAPAVEIRPGIYRAAAPPGLTLTLDERRRILAVFNATEKRGPRP